MDKKNGKPKVAKRTPEEQAELDKSLKAIEQHFEDRYLNQWIPNVVEQIIHKQLHPDAHLVIPLYRGAMVILPTTEAQRKRGAVSLRFYHDPAWISEQRTPEGLTRHSFQIDVYGQRNGPDLYYVPPQCQCFYGKRDSIEIPSRELYTHRLKTFEDDLAKRRARYAKKARAKKQTPKRKSRKESV